MARFLVGTRKGLFLFERMREGFLQSRLSFLGEPVSMLHVDPVNKDWYACLNLGHFGTKLHRSGDDGRSWTELAVPVYPEGATIGKHPFADDDDPNQKTKPASLDEIWAMESSDTASAGKLWAGTIPGGLFSSHDGGESWELCESLWNDPARSHWFGGGKDQPGIHSVEVDPRDKSRVAVGVSCGGVWETVDGGATWTCRADGMRAEYMPPDRAHDPLIQDPHRMVRCSSSPDTLWVQHHNGVFVTHDNCASWNEIEEVPPSGFGFAVAVDPNDPSTAWFVPAVKDECRVPVDGKFVVSKTVDGGKSFTVINEGLPTGNAYDIVFRHALEVDVSGRFLVMGSSTGGLWISEDAGVTWQLLSAHLPQVYCVKILS